MSYAIIFTGQGIINIQHFKKIILNEKQVKYFFDRTSEKISFNIWSCIQNNIHKIFYYKKYIQPIIFTFSVAIYKIWMKYKPLPKLAAGSSLGEYSALYCANAIKYSDAIKLLLIRSKYMQDCIKEKYSSMILIRGLNTNIIKKICKFVKKKNIVSIANFNTPKNIILTGNQQGIIQTINYCKKYDVKLILNLPIYTPSHCILLKKASKKINFSFKKIKIKKPKFNIIHNYNVKSQKKKKIKKTLIKQLYKPVRWEETINYITSKNIKKIIEIGSLGLKKYLNKTKKYPKILTLKNLYNKIHIIK
ncbi:ACP S-malonyltransferase [Buchnera aphidicola (Mollitrichosiphum nigrofasciatum)]|uniref:ACP S-malonyltransferase n=1 Tax=Buchnera aphidicola TaxID=9 RepID=UPI0031B8A1A7